MAKVYDPILCMMVDKPDKAQDAKVKDRLVKVPDNKLKEFEASLRSAGFKVVSKSDRGTTTHYQVEVNSSKKFSDKAELREWAEKIDAVCDKMDSVAPTTWNIGLTTDGKITAGLDVREMYVKDSASVLDEAIKACDASYEYEGTYGGAKIQITVPDEDGTRNVYLDGRALWQDEGSVNKVLSAVKQLIDNQKK